MSSDRPTETAAHYTDDSPVADPRAAEPADPGDPASRENEQRLEQTPKTGGALDTAAAAPTVPSLTVNAGLSSDAKADDDLLAPGGG
ncbi:MAG TPA: hypothetical protein VM345_19605 [Acidimicrobiales bacterium]|nr:hypothetical protein [Acidimicrobiales bacterium]